MKLLGLELVAFGKFTGVHLDLSEGNHGLHVVYGANEAGKSTTLRALHALLYGIPERTRDSFQHQNKDLRIGGRIRSNDGAELMFQRRKGRVKTLLDVDGQPLAEDSLDRFLGGVGADLFARVFGIDHERLLEGSQAIVEGGGEVGGSLFSAGLGGADIRRLVEELDTESKDLFLAQGRKPRINRALAEHRTIQEQIKESALPSSEWEQHNQALTRAESSLSELIAELQSLMTEKNRIEGVARSLGGISRRTLLETRIRELSDVVSLAEDFSDRRRESTAARDAARLTLETSRSQIRRLQARVEALEASPAIIDRTEAITALHQRLGEHRKAVADGAKRQGELDRLRADVAVLLAQVRPDLGLDEVENLRLTTARRSEINEVVARYGRVAEAFERADKKLDDLQRECGEVETELGGLDAEISCDTLARAVSIAQRKVDLEEARERAMSELDVERGQLTSEFERLSPRPDTLEALQKTPWPLAETVASFEDRLRHHGNERDRCDERIAGMTAELESCDRQINELNRAGDLPSEEDLAAVRERRDVRWTMIRGVWLEDEAPPETAGSVNPAEELADEFETDIRRADVLADGLRREADRVAAMAELRSQRTKAKKTLAESELQRREVLETIDRLEAEWITSWDAAGIGPGTPREMREWVTLKDALLQRIDRHRRMEAEVRRIDDAISSQRSALNGALRSVGEAESSDDETFEALLGRSAEVVGGLQRAKQRREALERRLADLEGHIETASAEREDAAAALKGWRSDFSRAVKALGLGSTALPGQALAVLEKLEELMSRVDEQRRIEHRVSAIERDSAAFAADVQELVAAVAPDLEDLPAESAAARLHDLLSKATAAAAKLTSFREQILSLEDDAAEAEQMVALMDARLDELCAEAGCEQPDELTECERRSNELLKARTELQSVEEHLVEQSGMELEDLLQEAEGAEAAQLELQIADLKRQISARGEQRSELDRVIGRERQMLDQMDGGDQAAELAELAAAKRAEIDRLVTRYQRLRLASAILRAEVEKYRAENQGPLVRRASELFARLTLGSFEGLEAGYDDKDEPILEGVRPGGAKVGVDGMSDGTRDQLYLALRLATLEKLLTVGESLPFVVDDILISFDDDRAKAALQVLADLSLKTQVLFFTHHRRLVELAAETASERVIIHEIGGAPA